MAGSYVDVPGRRIAWDADGTVGFNASQDLSKAATEWSAAEKADLNSEENVRTSSIVRDGYVWWIFPELREVDGLFAATQGTDGTRVGDVSTSGDTTNGVDGSWTTRIADYTDNIDSVIPEYRENITSLAVSNVRGVRLTFSDTGTGASVGFLALHLYGEIAPGETPDRLLWVDNDTGSEFGLPIDYGDIPRGSAEDTEVLLRNNSGTLTAASVQITAEDLYLAMGDTLTIKEAGGSFQATLPLASSLGPGADSPVLTIRRITPDDEQLGLHAARAVASVGSWS